jgi:hypothetical protein
LNEIGDRRNLWKLHDRLLSTVRIKRQNVVRNIELLLFLDFVMGIQNLHKPKEDWGIVHEEEEEVTEESYEPLGRLRETETLTAFKTLAVASLALADASDLFTSSSWVLVLMSSALVVIADSHLLKLCLGGGNLSLG